MTNPCTRAWMHMSPQGPGRRRSTFRFTGPHNACAGRPEICASGFRRFRSGPISCSPKDSALSEVRGSRDAPVIPYKPPGTSGNDSEPFGDRVNFLEDLLGFLWDHRPPSRSEARCQPTRVAEPAEVHVKSGRLQDFRKVVRAAVRPPGATVFSFTLPDDRSRPRMRQRREVDFPRRDRGRLPVRRPARPVLVDDVHPEVLSMDDRAGCLQESWDERPEFVT